MYSRLFFLFLLSFAGFSCSENEPVFESKDANFKTFNVEFNTFRLETGMPSKFELSNGTNVQIPAEAFVDVEGEPAEGYVYIHYRECHDAAEMIATGFILEQETDDMQMAREAGGMFEIRATDGSGEPLFLAEEKEITVRFASFAKGSDYAAYERQETDYEEGSKNNQSGFLFGKAYADGVKRNRTWKKLYVPETVPNYRKKRETDSARRRIYKDLLADPFGKNQRKSELNRLRTFKLKLNQTDVGDAFKTAIWEFAGSLEKTDPTLPENKFVLSKNWPHAEIVPADAGSPMLRFAVHKDLRGFRKGHEKAVTAVAFSPNYDYVLTGSEDLTVKLWDVSGHELLTLNHGSEVTDVTFSPDGKLVAAAGKNKLVRIWNLTGDKIAALRGHGDAISAARFSADGSGIITTGRDSTARYWSLTGRQLHEFTPAHVPGEKLDGTYRFTLPSYSPDGQFLLAGTSDGSVRYWNISQTELFRAEHGEEVLETVFSPGGSRLYSLGVEKLKVWNREGKMQTEISVPENLLSFTPSPDNEKVIFLSFDDSLKAELQLLPEGKTVPDEKTISDGKHLLDLTGHSRKIRRAAFSDNGSLILTGSDDKSANLYDLSILTKPENTYFVRFYDEYVGSEKDTVRLLKFSCALRLLDRKKNRKNGQPRLSTGKYDRRIVRNVQPNAFFQKFVPTPGN